ncbi:MAG: hypothetical protein D6729_18490 [Deltaproteobacteria bacterium]|nr:MAG: hypothetical protein D6729_18490 [Deltaproteobacteria bacterium]
MARFLTLLALCLSLLAAAAPKSLLAVEPDAMSADEYKLYREYQAALEDERVKKIKPKRRMRAIARNFGVPLKKLARVVKKGEQVADGLVEANQAAALKALKSHPKVGSLIRDLELVDQGGVVVAYVNWVNSDKDRLAQEAAYVARIVAEAAPVAHLLALWSCNGTVKVFTAKIRSSAAARIREERVEDFAATRYLRLFEDVHNAFAGNPPKDQKGCSE